MANEIKERGSTAVRNILVIAIAICVVLAAVYFFLGQGIDKQDEDFITTSRLQKIVNTSDLSTYTAIYNGIAHVTEEDNPDSIRYYVAYEAQIKAGIDFENIEIEIKETEQTKIIHVKLPRAQVQDVVVDISTLDYIFQDKKANTSGVTAEAYRACEDDARNESEAETEILKLAEENAENTVKALIRPFVEQLYDTYELSIEWEV